jgi:hypothetical protein
VTQRPELHRLRDDRHVDRHLGSRIFDVIGYPLDEEGDVIEELVSREDTIGVERDPIGNALQPFGGQLALRLPKVVREYTGERTFFVDPGRGFRSFSRRGFLLCDFSHGLST